MLHAPDEVIPALESLLDSVDPWVRAMGRWQVAKTRSMLSQGGRDMEAELEQALAEVKASAADTAGQYTLVEVTAPPGLEQH
jgi:hypothetical protein